VNVADCERVSRDLGAILDVEDVVNRAYTLEVSSPGLDRPLVTPEDFRRHLGATVKVRVSPPVAGRRNFTGLLLEVADDHVALDVDKERFDLAFADIDRARLVPKL